MAWSDFTDKILNASLATFGQSVTYIPLVGSQSIIQGIFEFEHVEVDLGHGGAPVSSVKPVLGIRLADLASKPAKGDTAIIGSVTYRVIDSEEDGNGGSTLRLQR